MLNDKIAGFNYSNGGYVILQSYILMLFSFGIPIFCECHQNYCACTFAHPSWSSNSDKGIIHTLFNKLYILLATSISIDVVVV